MSPQAFIAPARGGLLVAAHVFGAQVAAGSDAVEVRLEVTAAPGCATVEAVQSKIAARSDRIRFVEANASKVVRAAFEDRRDLGVSARLTLVQPSGKAATRELRARSCAEAVEALALVAAVTLDPLASTEPDVGASAPRPENTPARAEPAREQAPAQNGSRNQRAAGVVDADTLASPRDADTGGATSLGFGAVAASIWGPAPSMMPGLGAYFELASARRSLWSPALRATAQRLWRGGFDSQYGTASFALSELAVELCPIALHAGPVSLRPCAAITGGILQASGSNTESGRERTRPWSVGGASLRATALATERLEFSAMVSGGGAIVRDRFQFEPDVFHEVPALAFSGAIGVGVRFP